MSVTVRTIMGIVLAVAAAGAIAGGMMIVGSPGEARLRRFDERRVSDLRALANGIEVYYSRRQALPASLEAINKEGAWQTPPADPDTGAPYEYRVLGDTRYELCATFSLAAEGDPPTWTTDQFWAHTAGRQCFAVDVKAPKK